MGQIELVVKVDEDVYRECMNGYDVEIKVGDHIFTSDWATELIRNGTPLPKGHGDLIDRNELMVDYTSWYWDDYVSAEQIKNAEAVLVADTDTHTVCENNGDCEHCDFVTCPKMEGAEE